MASACKTLFFAAGKNRERQFSVVSHEFTHRYGKGVCADRPCRLIDTQRNERVIVIQLNLPQNDKKRNDYGVGGDFVYGMTQDLDGKA